MIAYEKYFDKRWSSKSKYSTAASAHTYQDGIYAPYSYGLGHAKVGGVDTVGHGGALRGWRIQRRYAIKDRLSVIVMLNHETNNAGKAASTIIRKVLKLPDPPTSDVTPVKEWFGHFLDKETQLCITVAQGPKGQVSIKIFKDAENIRLSAPDRAENTDEIATINGDTLEIHDKAANRRYVAQRVNPEVKSDGSSLQGSYRCSELESTFVVEGQDNMLYGAFDGPLGKGPANLMKRVSENVWFWACPRALDHTPPGDWTVVFKEDGSGNITGCTVSNWLARNNEFIKV
jgi:hypothetical protein